MKLIRQEFNITFGYDVAFTEGLFNPSNPLFANQIESDPDKPVPKLLFVLDDGVVRHHRSLFQQILDYGKAHEGEFSIVSQPVTLPGGEASKNDPALVQGILEEIERAEIDRHSYVVVVGGGAVIDTAGYAAAVAHRGVRLIRVPTTVLAQNDAAVGVKNGVNAFGKKNFLGTFATPDAVLNDFEFLKTLDERDWRSGISEAVKVALIKDAQFFRQLEKQAEQLRFRDMEAMQSLIIRCAELHLEHIATSGDPFETGSSRPLDFGHWAAHKLEHLTDYELRHGEAVAIGIALDTTYSHLSGLISEESWLRVLNLFQECGFRLYVPELESRLNQPEDADSLLSGLEEFREHLGGTLTIMLLQEIGQGIEVHQVDTDRYREAIQLLKHADQEPVSTREESR